jgi:hypothetical protein
MSQPPYALLRASINGGAATTGGLTVPASATVQLSADPAGTSGVYAYKFQIYGYPVGFSVPSGWSTDSSGVYFYSASSTPPIFTLPAITTWGKWMLRLIVNNGISSNETVTPSAQLVDEMTALDMLSGHGLHDIGVNESTQWSPNGWVTHQQANLRIIQTLLP